MREIKFRGKTVSGEWVYGNLTILRQTIRNVERGTYISNDAGMPFAYQVIPETVGQYIGLEDQNGTDVYEGDIIRKEMCAPDDMAYGFYGDEGIIEYHKNAMRYVIRRDDDDTVVFWDMSSCEIIGNIYENPELLGVEP